MPINDLYQQRTVTYSNQQAGINIRYWKVDSFTGTEATPAQCATALDALVAPAYKPLLVASATYRGVGFRRITGVKTIQYYTTANTGVGTVAGDQLPTQVSGLITFYSTTPGRSGRGRFYVAFPGEADNTATANAQATYVTRLTTLGNIFAISLVAPGTGGSTTLIPVLYNRKTTGTIPLFPGGTVYPHSTWATQRKRGGYGKTNILPF